MVKQQVEARSEEAKENVEAHGSERGAGNRVYVAEDSIRKFVASFEEALRDLILEKGVVVGCVGVGLIFGCPCVRAVSVQCHLPGQLHRRSSRLQPLSALDGAQTILPLHCRFPRRTPLLPRSSGPEQVHTPRESHRRHLRADQPPTQLQTLVIGAEELAARPD